MTYRYMLSGESINKVSAELVPVIHLRASRAQRYAFNLHNANAGLLSSAIHGV